MHRIDSTTKSVDKFGSGKHGYTEGTPGVTAATETTAETFDEVQEEICETIEGAGTTLAKGTRTQLRDAIKKLAANGVVGSWETILPSGKAFDLNDIVYSEELELFVAVGAADGVDGYILTSSDGYRWTERAGGAKNVTLNGVAWSPSLTLFVAVGENDGGDSYIVTSPDGTTWTERASPSVEGMNDVTWSVDLSLFCAVGDDDGADATIYTSSNGTAWTERANGLAFDLFAVTWSPALTLFCAVGQNNAGGSPYIITSPDGTTWTTRTAAAAFNGLLWFGVAWSPELAMFVAGGNSTPIGGAPYSSPMAYSTDGTTWTQGTGPLTDGVTFDFVEPKKIAWAPGPGCFVAAVHEGGSYGGGIMASIDGIAWKRRVLVTTSGGPFDIHSVCWSVLLGCFISVGTDTGADSPIYRSGSALV